MASRDDPQVIYRNRISICGVSYDLKYIENEYTTTHHSRISFIQSVLSTLFCVLRSVSEGCLYQ